MTEPRPEGASWGKGTRPKVARTSQHAGEGRPERRPEQSGRRDRQHTAPVLVIGQAEGFGALQGMPPSFGESLSALEALLIDLQRA